MKLQTIKPGKWKYILDVYNSESDAISEAAKVLKISLMIVKYSTTRGKVTHFRAKVKMNCTAMQLYKLGKLTRKYLEVIPDDLPF